MATIALLGATGRSGVPFTKLALQQGHTIHALVRDPLKMTIQHPQLRVIKGDALNPVSINNILEGADGVVSFLGQDKASEADLQTKATSLIISAMKARQLRRFISITGGGVRDAAHDKPGFMDNMIVFIMKNLAGASPRNALADGISHAELIKQSGLNWTIVRGPMLTDDPARGTYKVGYVGTVGGIKLTRADLAAFVLEEWENGEWTGKMPFVTNG